MYMNYSVAEKMCSYHIINIGEELCKLGKLTNFSLDRQITISSTFLLYHFTHDPSHFHAQFHKTTASISKYLVS